MAKIKIDQNKCKFSDGCRRCLEICPMFVFLACSDETRTKEKAPKKYYVKPFVDFLCIGCLRCVKECKEGAISNS